MSGQPHRKTRRTFNIAGHAHALTFSCYHGLKLLNNNRTRQWLLEAVDLARDRYRFDVWAYVIMPEHVHLLIRPNSVYDMSAILKAIKQPVARKAMQYLREHDPALLAELAVRRPSGRTEHRFWQQGGGYDRNIHDPATARHIIDYIHHNPVRRGLAAGPIDWPWSSARWYADLGDVKLAIDQPDFC